MEKNLDIQELDLEDMEQVTGGVKVDTGVDGLNAAVREKASKGSKQIASLPNGTEVEVVTGKLVYDSVAERHFVEVHFKDKRGTWNTGWIASSILGMTR